MLIYASRSESIERVTSAAARAAVAIGKFPIPLGRVAAQVDGWMGGDACVPEGVNEEEL